MADNLNPIQEEATEAETENVIERKFDSLTFEKPVGALKSIKLSSLGDNPHREKEVFKYNDEKIEGLIESYIAVGFQSTYEATTDKWGNFFIGGGGHHRTEALRRAIERGLGGRIRGLFKDDDGDWCIKLVVKKYTKEEMLQAFMLENADAWGKDEQSNICMMVMQIKSHLDKILNSAANCQDFIKAVNSPYVLKMDDRSFSRTKNSGKGAGASLIRQYVGENTWSRPAIQMALDVLYAEGPDGEAMRELAQKLPNIVMMYKFKHLMTEEVDGEKVLSSSDDQAKAQKLIENNALNRKDIEEANKIKADEGLSPLDALDKVIASKKEAKKGDAPERTQTEPNKKAPKESEEALESLKRAKNTLILLTGSVDSFSKAQFNQAKSILNDIVEEMKKMEPKSNTARKAAAKK